MRVPLSLAKPRLTASWRRLHRSYTVICGLALALASAAYEHLPLFQSLMPQSRFAWLSAAMGVLIALLRYVDQPCLRASADSSDSSDSRDG